MLSRVILLLSKWIGAGRKSKYNGNLQIIIMRLLKFL